MSKKTKRCTYDGLDIPAAAAPTIFTSGKVKIGIPASTSAVIATALQFLQTEKQK